MNKGRIFVVLSLALVGCAAIEEKENRSAADNLFNKSVELIKLFTDSLSSASDSVAVYRILGNYDHDISKLNYEFPPDTDYLLTEEENDSLIKLMDNMIKIKKDKLKSFSLPLSSDSIPSDSLKKYNPILL